MKIRNFSISTVLALVLAVPLLPARAEVTLSGALGSNMVLQRDRPATLWGWADAGEKVTVKMGDLVVANAVGQGKETMWRVQLPVQKAGPVADIAVTGSANTVKLTNLLAGDVWLCSGQSNMAMTVMNGPWCHYGGVLNAEKEVTEGIHPEIRLYTVQNGGAPQPQMQVTGAWTVCGPESLPSASAAAYFFGRELQSKLNIPIGLVISALGGSSVEPWTPKEALVNDAAYAALVAGAKKLQSEIGRQASEDRKLELEWRKLNDEARAKNQPAPAPPTYQLTPAQRLAASNIRPILDPGSLYNGKIHPLTPLTIKGAIWYQGEANASRAEHYAHSLKKLIEGWRNAFDQPFPFLIVQLANFEAPVVNSASLGSYALVREAQEKVAQTVPDCGIATAVDIGMTANIHPPNKQEVGRRLAQVALQQVYGQKVVADGPRYEGVRFEGGKAIVRFTGASGPLIMKGNGSFEIAGEDRFFVPATATLKGDTVEVAAPSVAQPVAVRYAFLNAPAMSLYDAEGWPALPFRSDNWEIPKSE
jgi:sialate O-acetylesterase